MLYAENAEIKIENFLWKISFPCNLTAFAMSSSRPCSSQKKTTTRHSCGRWDTVWTNVLLGLIQNLVNSLPLGANGQRCHGVVDHSEDDLTKSGDFSYGLGVDQHDQPKLDMPNCFSDSAQELMAVLVWITTMSWIYSNIFKNQHKTIYNLYAKSRRECRNFCCGSPLAPLPSSHEIKPGVKVKIVIYPNW